MTYRMLNNGTLQKVMKKVTKKNLIRRNLIMKAILDSGQLSLTDIKKITGISLPIVSSLVSQLEKENSLSEVVDKQILQAGRPPSVYKINGQAGYILGVDIGRLNTNYIILDLELNIIAETRKKSIKLSDNNNVVNELYKEITNFIASTDVKIEQILSIGVSIPGIVQGPLGISYTYFNDLNKPIKELLTEKFKKPVHVEHDVKAMTLGELHFGAARGKGNVICVNIGYGLAAGLIINGQLFYGSNYFAGEFGHMQINPEGPLCYCGKRGCLEKYCSGNAIASIANKRLEDGAISKLSEETVKKHIIDAKTIIEYARNGDQFSIEILEEAGKSLGYGLAQLINVLNPEMIILGGQVSASKEYLVNSISSAAIKHSLTHLNRELKFVVSNLGTKAGALGVARLASNDIFEVGHLNPTAYI